MKTTTLILSAMIATLPAAGNAAGLLWDSEDDYNYTYTNVQRPAVVARNGNVTQAQREKAYQTSEPTAADQTHIATTAYVKGAYNDTIAAINAVAHDVDDLNATKQNTMTAFVNGVEYGVDDTVMNEDEFAGRIAAADFVNAEAKLVTGKAVADALADRDTALANKRVKIYTTWDDDRDSATTEVSLVTATSSN